MNKYSRFFSLLILITVISGFVPSRLVHATGYPVIDVANLSENTVTAAEQTTDTVKTVATYVKDFSLDKIAFMVSQKLLKKMTASIVNWATTGFHGDPFYIRDQGSFFKNIADTQILDIVSQLQLTADGKPISPFNKDIAKSILISNKENYLSRSKFDLDKSIGPNWKNFGKDFDVGGWDGFLNMTLKSQNNPIGSAFITQRELSSRIISETQKQQNELTQTNFLSMKKCVQYKPGQTNSSNNNLGISVGNIDIAGVDNCAKYEVTTPGSIIKDQLSKAIGAGQDKTVAADSFNEVISNALTSLVTDLASKGLSSLSSSNNPSTSSGGLNGSTFVPSSNDLSSWSTTPDQAVWTDVETFKNVIGTINPPGTLNTSIAKTDQEVKILTENVAATKQIPGLIKALDLCLPGPDGNWEEIVNDTLSDILNNEDVKIGDGSSADRQAFKSSVEDSLQRLKDIMETGTIPSAPMILDKINSTRDNEIEIQQAQKTLSQKRSTLGTLQSILTDLRAISLPATNSTFSDSSKKIITQDENLYKNKITLISSDDSIAEAQGTLSSNKFEIQDIDRLLQKCTTEKRSTMWPPHVDLWNSMHHSSSDYRAFIQIWFPELYAALLFHL